MEKYPEHVKLKAVSAKSQACGEFLDWLVNEKGFMIAQYDKRNPNWLVQVSERRMALVAEWLGIDEKKIEAEKVAMLEEMRADG